MTLFEYLGVLISVVIGLAVTYLITGLVGLIQNRDNVRVYWVHLVWVAFLLNWLVHFWWFFFSWREAPDWTLELFLFFLIYALLLSVIAGLLFPAAHAVSDYREFFLKQAPWFFSIQIIANGLDIAEVTMKADLGIRSIPSGYFILMGAMILGLLAGAITRSERYHAGLAVFAFLWSVGYGIGVF